MKRTITGCLLLTWGLFAMSASADNWERFRGPNGTGTVTEQNIPLKWTAKNILWKTPIPGSGNSSPVAWGDKVFVQTSPDVKSRALVCVDAKTGKILWTQKVDGNKAKTHKRNSLASSTPCVDADRVYAQFWDGEKIALHAYDHNGKPVWSQDLGKFTSQHGAGHSPVVYDGKVIINNDQDGTAHLLALDATTGKKVWEVPRTPFRACYSTPFLNGDELLVASTAGVAGYDIKSGKQLWIYNWSFDGMPLRTVASPILHQGIVFASSGDGSGARHAIAVKKGEKGDVTGKNLVWENKKLLPYVPTMLAKGDHIYLVNDFGIAACLQAKTGKEVYSERLGSPVSASPVMIDGNIFVCAEDGNVYIYAADPTFKVLAKNALNERVIASPAVANKRLFIRSDKNLICIGQ